MQALFPCKRKIGIDLPKISLRNISLTALLCICDAYDLLERMEQEFLGELFKNICPPVQHDFKDTLTLIMHSFGDLLSEKASWLVSVFPLPGISFWTVILFSRCCSPMKEDKSTPK